jgi:hypothetical protein
MMNGEPKQQLFQGFSLRDGMHGCEFSTDILIFSRIWESPFQVVEQATIYIERA